MDHSCIVWKRGQSPLPTQAAKLLDEICIYLGILSYPQFQIVSLCIPLIIMANGNRYKHFSNQYTLLSFWTPNPQQLLSTKPTRNPPRIHLALIYPPSPPTTSTAILLTQSKAKSHTTLSLDLGLPLLRTLHLSSGFPQCLFRRPLFGLS
jgi:hypothetical protein